MSFRRSCQRSVNCPTDEMILIIHVFLLCVPDILIQYSQSTNTQKMVDVQYFSEYVRELTMYQDHLVLNYKKLDYSVKISFTDQHCCKVTKIPYGYPKRAIQIMAVYGIINMEINKYLVVVTKASIVGQIFKRTIFHVHKLEYICLSPKQHEIDKIYIKGLSEVLDNQSLYFSYDYDLTQYMQSFMEGKCEMGSPRDDYMYNSVWVSKLVEVGAKQWVTPFISGYISIDFVQINAATSLELCLITRRDKRRQGLRYLTRGANLQGNTANTCETQLILTAEQQQYQQYFSFVQLRGSFPFLWKQDPDLKWTPSSHILSDESTNKEIAIANFQQLQREYSECTIVNLVDKKGFQKQLGDYLSRLHGSINSQNIQLIWFDFHQECKNMKYANLAKLIDLLQQKLQNYGYFRLQHSKNDQNKYFQVKKQKGVIRTNCVDCLDRTNVVQSVIARRVILKWLLKLKIVDNVNQFSAFQVLPGNMEQIFRGVWADNANALSRLYSGTDAMKNDFTKTGKRTFSGALNDAKVGTKRYFLGNFYDSRKQDFVHFSLGQLRPDVNQNQHIRHSRVNSIIFLGVALISLPLIVHTSVDHVSEEDSPKIALKAGVTALSYLIFYQICRFFKNAIVRKPIPID